MPTTYDKLTGIPEYRVPDGEDDSRIPDRPSIERSMEDAMAEFIQQPPRKPHERYNNETTGHIDWPSPGETLAPDERADRAARINLRGECLQLALRYAAERKLDAPGSAGVVEAARAFYEFVIGNADGLVERRPLIATAPASNSQV